jgi:hypothetical protein
MPAASWRSSDRKNSAIHPRLAAGLRRPTVRLASREWMRPAGRAGAVRTSRAARAQPPHYCPDRPAAYFANSPPNPRVDARLDHLAASNSDVDAPGISAAFLRARQPIRSLCRIPPARRATLGRNMAKGRIKACARARKSNAFRRRSRKIYDRLTRSARLRFRRAQSRAPS